MAKYDNHFITEPVVDGKYIKKRMAFYGAQHFSDLKYWVRWNCFTQEHAFIDPPHSHDFDQLFHFIGGDPMDITDFGAEVEFHLEDEVHVFNRMTLVYVPKGMKHCPIYVRNVKKPIMFMNVAFTDNYLRAGEEKSTMRW
jgi:hypothetical protein